MSEQSSPWRIEQVIPSDTAAGKRLLDEILTQLAVHHWTERDIFSVHLAMEEALVNAIKHGNCSDFAKQVHVVCQVSRERMSVVIRDEGEGFNPDEVPDPTDPDKLEVPSGRGVLLMRSFMSSVEYNGAGNCVTMTKNCRIDECGTKDRGGQDGGTLECDPAP
jgi:serine/threonine-protein kinase RsbW